ncbi:hypothetical protein OAK19_05745, partial [Aureispira]|nr:hypothetical protein [Aureispira sp.]
VIMLQPGSLFTVQNYPLHIGSPGGPVFQGYQTAVGNVYTVPLDVGTVDPGTPGTPGTAAVEPNELPMGDNFGLAHIDYSCQYTEHIGACVYHETGERNLYDCGQGYVPKITSSAGSIEASRMILPAVDVVRQAKRYGFDVDSNGAPTNLSVDNATSGN